MEVLKQRIIKDGHVLEGNILKIDSFLNHQIDPQLAFDIGKEFHNRFKGLKVDKILTIETSGIAFAVCAGYHFNVPVVFAKKYNGGNMSTDIYQSKVHSYTKNTDYVISVSKQFLHSNESILIIDDFLAKGQAVLGLIDIANQANANVTGVGVVVEKAFQLGGQTLRNLGIRLESLAVIESLSNKKIIFREAF